VNEVGVPGLGTIPRGNPDKPAFRGSSGLRGSAAGVPCGFDFAFVVESPESDAAGALGTGTFFWVT
jgi:hypothetical protein